MITKYIRAYIGKDHNFHIRYVRKAYRKARWKKRNKRYYIRDADAFLQLWIELLDDMMQRDIDRQLSEIEAVIIGDRGVREQLKQEAMVKPTKCPCGELFDAKDSSFCPKCGCAYGELSGRYTNMGR